MKPAFVALGLLWAFMNTSAVAHEITIHTSRDAATVITLHYGDGTPFSFEAYEIYVQGKEVPMQVGRTDAQGRIAFLHQEGGDFRLKAFAEDGHGVDRVLTLESHEAALVPKKEGVELAWFWKVIAGVLLILGLFGLLRIGWRKRSHSK